MEVQKGSGSNTVSFAVAQASPETEQLMSSGSQELAKYGDVYPGGRSHAKSSGAISESRPKEDFQLARSRYVSTSLAAKLAVRSSPELDHQDIARLSEVVSSDSVWIAFCSADARWIQFTSEMRHVFLSLNAENGKEHVEQWLDHASSVMSTWIANQIVATAARASHFRSLGRGWIWIQLSSGGARQPDVTRRSMASRTRFKWWFENVDRVLRNRHEDLKLLDFIGDVKGDLLEKYISGYMPLSEFVFVIKGFAADGRPTIGIQKWAADYRRLGNWVNDNEAVVAAVAKPMATDAERHQHAVNLERRKARKQRQRERQKLKKQEEKDKVAEKSKKQYQDEFESLLARLKLEEQATRQGESDGSESCGSNTN